MISSQAMAQEADLANLAVQELLLEADRGKQRSESMGPTGWKKRTMSTNKIFLKNTIRGVVTENRHLSQKEVSSGGTSRHGATRDKPSREGDNLRGSRDVRDGRTSSRKRQGDVKDWYDSRFRHDREGDKDLNPRTAMKDYKHKRRKGEVDRADNDLCPRVWRKDYKHERREVDSDTADRDLSPNAERKDYKYKKKKFEGERSDTDLSPRSERKDYTYERRKGEREQVDEA